MSNITNDRWLEAAWENFADAVDAGDYNLAKDIIEDTRDKGFSIEAEMMLKNLLDQNLNKFANPSPIWTELK